MRFAKWVFNGAGAYGLLALLPLYFKETSFGVTNPPAITHPAFFYGFIGCAVAFQLIFFTIARDPVKYRPFMLAALVEKVSFVIPCFLLQAQGRLAPDLLYGAILDLILGILFVAAYFKTRP